MKEEIKEKEKFKLNIVRVKPESLPCRSVDNYKIIETIGGGTFGRVYKAKVIKPPENSELKQNDYVALKRIELNQEKYEVFVNSFLLQR